METARTMFRPDYLDALSPQSQSGDRLRYARKFRAPEKAPSSVKTMACPRLTMGRMTRHSMAEHKRILVVGAGAIGGLYAAYLAKVSDVAVLDTNRAHVEAIRRNGLKLAGCTESVTKLAAFASAAEIGKRRFDSVIILVKSQATGAALVSIRPALEGRPLLVTFQNGMGNEELLMGLTDLDVAHGVSFEAARHDGPGRVHHLVH